MTYYPETETTITLTGGHVLTVRHRIIGIDTAFALDAALDASQTARPDTDDGRAAQRSANHALGSLILRVLADHCAGDEWRQLIPGDAYRLVTAMASASPLSSTT